MRPIKFRAWHQPTNKIYRVRSMNFTFENGVTAMLDEYPYKGDKRFTTLKYDKLMQFTGLLDKNGKEIYEGDIVRDDSFKDDLSSLFRDMAVVWDEIACCFTRNPKNNQHFQLSTHRCWMYEVIGNIHENPELLK